MDMSPEKRLSNSVEPLPIGIIAVSAGAVQAPGLRELALASEQTTRNVYYHPVLTKEEERILFGILPRAKDGRSYEDVPVANLLRDTQLLETIAMERTPSEQERWLSVLKFNDTVKGVIAACNQSSVALVSDRVRTSSLRFEAKRAAGNKGLMRAIEGFDLKRDRRFITYSQNHILFAIQEESRHYHGISRRTAAKLAVVRYMTYGFQTVFQRLPQRDELERQLLANADGEEGRPKLPVRGMGELLSVQLPVSAEPFSLDMEISHESNTTYADMLAAEEPSEHTSAMDESGAFLDAALEQLTPLERHIVTSLFGLLGQSSRSLADVVAEVQLDEEEVRSLLARSINTMRRMPDVHKAATGLGYDTSQLPGLHTPQDSVSFVGSDEQSTTLEATMIYAGTAEFSEKEIVRRLEGASEVLVRVARMALAGCTTVDVGRELGVSRERVRQYGVELAKRSLPRPMHVREKRALEDRIIHATEPTAPAKFGAPSAAMRKEWEKARAEAQSLETELLRAWMKENPYSKRPHVLSMLKRHKPTR